MKHEYFWLATATALVVADCARANLNEAKGVTLWRKPMEVTTMVNGDSAVLGLEVNRTGG